MTAAVPDLAAAFFAATGRKFVPEPRRPLSDMELRRIDRAEDAAEDQAGRRRSEGRVFYRRVGGRY